MRPTKTQISLRICAVWSVFVVRIKKLCIYRYPKCDWWRFWSDCANAQADLNLRCLHMSQVMFSAVAAHTCMCLTLILLNNLISLTHFWLSANQKHHIMFSFKFTNWMTNSVAPDQMASEEAVWSGSTLFTKVGVVVNSRIRVVNQKLNKVCILESFTASWINILWKITYIRHTSIDVYRLWRSTGSSISELPVRYNGQ